MNIEDFKIFRADISMIKQFVELEISCFSGDVIKEPEYRTLFKRPKTARIYGLWYKEQLIASAVVKIRTNKNKSYLYSLCVRKEYRNLGLALAMLDGIEQDCARLGMTSMYLEVSVMNEPAYLMYAHRGYFKFGKYKKFYEDGSDAVRMQKILTLREPFTKTVVARTVGV